MVRNEWTNHFEEHPEELQPFPRAGGRVGARPGVNHLGAPSGTEVDVAKEFMPAGQGVGAIDELVPAGDLVRAMVRRGRSAIDRPTGGRPPMTSDDRTATHELRSTTIWTRDIVPALHDYIRIPNVSEAFDPTWDEHGHMRRAVELIRRLVRRPARSPA